MDHAPAVPAFVRALLLPVGKINNHRFSSFVARLGEHKIISLADVSPDGRPHRTMFSPLAFPAGTVLYDLTTSLPPPSHFALTPFELYREPLVVVALADGNELLHATDEAPNTAQEDRVSPDENFSHLLNSLDRLKVDYHRALVHQVLVFDYVSAVALPAGVVAVPSPEQSKTTTIKTLMANWTSLLLAEMTTLAKSFQALPSLDSPTTPLSTRSLNGKPSSLDFDRDNSSKPSRPTSNTQGFANDAAVARFQNRMSMPTQRPSGESSGTATPPTTFDAIAGVSRTSSPVRSDERRQSSRDGISIQGLASSGLGERERIKGKGRIGVVIGSLYLLAGRWPDAVKELVESASIARGHSDYLWHAKSLDYILVCLFMYAWAGMDFQIPQICYPGTEKSNPSSNKAAYHTPSSSLPDLTSLKSSNPASRLVSIQNLINLLPDLVTNILNLYARATTFTDDRLPQLAYSESTIRFSRLLSIIQLSHGNLDDGGLKRVIFNIETPLKKALPSQLTQFPSKSEICALLFRAFPTPTSLSTADHVTVLIGIASVLGSLGYDRKKALVLKELISTLLPALIQARKAGAAEMGVHPAASLTSLDTTNGGLNPLYRDSSFDGSEDGLQDFLSIVCKIYGVVLSTQLGLDNGLDSSTASGSDASNKSHRDSTESIVNRAIQQATTRSFGARPLKVDLLRSCINLCEALPDLEGVLRFSADLLRTAGSGLAPAPNDKDSSPALTVEDQVRLASNISRTVGAARKLGLEQLETEYWDEFLVRGIEVIESSLSKPPKPHAKAELEVAETISKKTDKSPFIYNPFLKVAPSSVAEPLLVALEEAGFKVTLQNLYDFDVEVEWIRLECSGVSFDNSTLSTIIGPYRTQSVFLSGTPKTAGSLNITGCIAKIKGCRERRFPIFSTPWASKQDIKSKYVGLAANGVELTPRPGSRKVPGASQGPIASTIALKVIEPQPELIVTSISLSQSAIMLLEGETKTFTVTLQNLSSTVPADLLLLSFNDSTTSHLQSATANKDLSPADIYELELSSLQNQALRWKRKDVDGDAAIAPGGEITLEIEVLGKPGFSQGTVQVDYGYLGMPKVDVKDRFYTRQVTIPLNVTVNASIDLVRNDIIPLNSDFASSQQQLQRKDTGSLETHAHNPTPPVEEHASLSHLLQTLNLHSSTEDHCLLLLDLRNSWPNTLLATLEIRLPPSEPTSPPTYTQHTTLQPGQTNRLILPLPLLHQPNQHHPIPSLNPLTKRQYIHQTNTPSPQTERATRESFWYRHQLLSLLHATWHEPFTNRTGIINTRAIRLNARMISALKVEEIGIEMTLSPAEETPPSPKNNSNTTIFKQLSPFKYFVKIDAFLTLTTRITNRTSDPIRPFLRLQPTLRNQPHTIALDLSKKFAWSGLLQRALPLLGPGESREVSLGVCVLCEGEFEIGALVEEVRALERGGDAAGGSGSGGRNRAGTDGFGGMGRGVVWRRGERRVWGVREVCVVYGRDVVR